MLKMVKILSDYTPADQPNILNIYADDQGDFNLFIFNGNDDASGVRIAASGTRYNERVRAALRNLFEVMQTELNDPQCHPEIKELNDMS